MTGEEEEECIFKMRCKLYRKRDEQMKERGTGNVRLMRHKETQKIRVIMRQDKTLKPVANFLSTTYNYLIYIVTESPLCELTPMKNNDKAYVWSCNDFSDEEPKLEMLAGRFQTSDSNLSYLTYIL